MPEAGLGAEIHMKILHITAHMGGGAGKAIGGLLTECAKRRNVEQKLLVLEIPEKRKYLFDLERGNIEVIIGGDVDLADIIAWADVVVVSWWNHPLMAMLLGKLSGIECRLALWVHVNGCSYPYLPFGFADIHERLFITTEYTMENPMWNPAEQRKIAQKALLISGIGDFHPQDTVAKEDYGQGETFVVGYAGTLNYAKMHKDYLSFCQAAIQRIPEIRFLIVGDRGEQLQEEIRQYGLQDYFSFTGYVEDVSEQFRRMDVMGYLLNADNYGTTENVILEAMAAGLPVIACKNGPESCILQDGLNGYLIETPGQYAECLNRLYGSEELREQIGKAARDYVIENYSISDTAERFMDCLYKMRSFPRKTHDFARVAGEDLFQWFKSFTGPDKQFFDDINQKSSAEIKIFLRNCPSIYKERTKSSFRHFLEYYECKELQLLADACSVLD